MRHRLLPHWSVLWSNLGIRPMDAGQLTLAEIMSIEVSLEAWAIEAARSKLEGGR